jgi:hypothetical protein
VSERTAETVRHELADTELALEDASASKREGIEAARDALVEELARLTAPAEVVEGSAEEEVAETGAADYTGPFGTELVVGAAGEDLWRVLDAHDEELILRELENRALPTLLYDFEGAGRTRMVDLSIYGVRECARLLNSTGKVRIGIDPGSLRMGVDNVDGVDYVTCIVYAREEVTGYGEFGMAREPRRQKIKESTARKYKGEGKPVFESQMPDGTTVYRTFDDHAEKKALAKATRNALRTMIPERMRQQMIALKKGDATQLRVIERGAGATQDAALPAPADSPRAKELTAEVAQVWGEIRGLARDQGRVTPPLMPGQYGNRLRQASHSEEMLEALRDELAGMLGAMKEGKL